MPQLDLSTYVTQLFWLFLTFGFLYTLLAFFFLPKLSKIISRRINQINSLLKKAEEMKVEAADIDYEISHALEKVRQDSKKRFEEQVVLCNKKFSEETMRLELELSDKTQIAEIKANEFKSKAINELEKFILETVMLMYSNLVKKDIKENEAEVYVKTAIFDINNKV